jgi:effector-binding domain-containing protein
MSAKKTIIVILLTLLSGLLIWYFFIKKSDYSISFTAKASTGTVYQGIQDWASARLISDSENYRVVDKEQFTFLKHEMNSKNDKLEYIWNINNTNDSIVKVVVGVREIGHSFYNRLTAPFFNTPFKKQQIDKIKALKKGLEEHSKSFKIEIVGEGKSEEVFVAYINLKSVLQEKAQTMIRNDGLITGYLQRNGIKIIGRPYLEVVDWDLETEKLDFNYCFPIDKSTKYVEDPIVKFKTIPSLKGLKVNYYGNFRTSDRAWFSLLDYASDKGYVLDLKPVEHFLANPFNGGNELEWQTTIIIPFSVK